MPLRRPSSVAHWGIARIVPAASARAIDWEAAEGRIIRFLAAHPDSTGTDLYRGLGLAEATVSRLGNQLEQDGLSARERAGKWLRWRLTHEGAQVLRAAAQAGLTPACEATGSTTHAVTPTLGTAC